MAFVPRTGSTAFAQSILDKFYPNEKSQQVFTVKPAGSKNLVLPQYFIPSVTKLNSSDVVVATMRHPIERFKSGCSRALNGNDVTITKNVDYLISSLFSTRNKMNIDLHIRPVTHQFQKYMSNITWYCYESKLADLATAIGLDSVPSTNNASDLSQKPNLTLNQIMGLNEFYADDLALYNSLQK